MWIHVHSLPQMSRVVEAAPSSERTLLRQGDGDRWRPAPRGVERRTRRPWVGDGIELRQAALEECVGRSLDSPLPVVQWLVVDCDFLSSSAVKVST